VNRYQYDSTYNKDCSFTRIKFGYDIPVLETELNDIQVMQENQRTSLVRRLIPSGFIELIQKEYKNIEPIIFNPVHNGAKQENKIAIAPARAFVNGYELTLSGTLENEYVLIDLGQAPEEGVREDLVFLETWFEFLDHEMSIKKDGYHIGDDLNYSIVDKRINSPTSQRVVLKWNIRTVQNVDFNYFKNGLGFESNLVFNPIYAEANGKLKKMDKNLIYMSASNETYKNCDFYCDDNLYVANRPNTNLTSSTIYGNYIFAIPLFRIKRRNKGKYSLSNFNGSNQYNNLPVSIENGDLNDVRPDGLSYNYINQFDIIDLRKRINIKEFNNDYYLNKGLKQLFTGELQTKDTNQLRRLQFGNTKLNYTDNNYIVFVNSFNRSIKPYLANNPTPQYSATGDGNLIYRDNISGYGLLLNGKNEIVCQLQDLDMNAGTIDFYLQPDWNSPDNCKQTILSLLDANDNLVLKFEKIDSQMILNIYDDVNSTFVNKIYVDLKQKLLLAKETYHMRISFSTYLGMAFIYLNGKMIGQGTHSNIQLIPAKIKFGAIETIENGCVIEECIVYKKVYEEIITTNELSYINNAYWGNIPNDVIYGNSLLQSSFNGIIRNYQDNEIIQENTVFRLANESSDSNSKFTFYIPEGKTLIGTPIVYKENGEILTGTWTTVSNNEMFFISNIPQLPFIYIKFDLKIPAGSGGSDVPNELLKAGLQLENGKFQEISFHRKHVLEPRKINYLKPRRVSNKVDCAYDYSLNRENNNASARLLHYYLTGNNTNVYRIAKEVYGYPVLGIQFIENNKIVKLKKYDTYIEFELLNSVGYGEIVSIQIVLGGIVFEYETQTKTLIHDIHRTHLLEITGNGTDNVFTIPCFTGGNCGILKSTMGFIDNIYDQWGKIKETKNHRVAYYNDSMFFTTTTYDPVTSEPTGTKTELITYEVDQNSFGTPFITITFNIKPPTGVKVTVPVLTSYHPKETDIVSIWYNHIPYQGLLGVKEQKIKRISDWKYFITTLSSGSNVLKFDENNIYSLNNLINRLPGGKVYSYLMDGDKIKLNHLLDTLNKSDVNSELLFVKDVVMASKENMFDNYFTELETDYIVSKNAENYQDGILNINKNIRLYFPDLSEDITKYLGMASLVLTESGEIMLFIIGNFEKTADKECLLIPTYGDLFRLKDIPTMIPIRE